jgi:hypothetical protein
MMALAASLAILLVAQGADFTVLKTLQGPDLLADGIDAQVIDLPKAASADAFAEQVVQAERLKAWDDGPITDNKQPGPLGYKATSEGSGKTVVAYYSREASGPRVVCRLRTKGATGLSPARYRALRWCAEQVGVTLPMSPVPPVAQGR